jgi:hypothetical protein
MERVWSLLRSWLRPHRGISQARLPLCLGFFQVVHNARRRGWAVSAGDGVELRDCRSVPWVLEPKRHADRGPAGV